MNAGVPTTFGLDKCHYIVWAGSAGAPKPTGSSRLRCLVPRGRCRPLRRLPEALAAPAVASSPSSSLARSKRRASLALRDRELRACDLPLPVALFQKSILLVHRVKEIAERLHYTCSCDNPRAHQTVGVPTCVRCLGWEAGGQAGRMAARTELSSDLIQLQLVEQSILFLLG
jgi:hypothetical protein